jgi:hypothetical protein
MKRVVHQLVVLADGEIRLPPEGGPVTHGHRSPDHQITIEMPANKKWLLVEMQVEVEEAGSEGTEAIGAWRPSDV